MIGMVVSFMIYGAGYPSLLVQNDGLLHYYRTTESLIIIVRFQRKSQ